MKLKHFNMALRLGKKMELYKGKFITVNGTEFFDKNGKLHLWEWMEKADVVAVLPITAEGKLVLIKNYRVPIEKYVIESPAGLHDKKDEALEEAAKRELLEEAGYEADHWVATPPWPYRPGSSKNVVYGFIATGLRKLSDQAGDATEDITMLELSYEELGRLYLNPSPDTLIAPEIMAMYEMARFLKIVP